jgi:hypothetical protein
VEKHRRAACRSASRTPIRTTSDVVVDQEVVPAKFEIQCCARCRELLSDIELATDSDDGAVSLHEPSELGWLQSEALVVHHTTEGTAVAPDCHPPQASRSSPPWDPYRPLCFTGRDWRGAEVSGNANDVCHAGQVRADPDLHL